MPGGDELTTSYHSTSPGVGGGLTGLVIESTTTGETFVEGGNKVVHMALDLPKQTKIKGVRVCYELTDHRWTMFELLSYQLPLPAWVEPKRRKQRPTAVYQLEKAITA